MSTGIEHETQHADFGDERLNKRYRILLGQLSEKPSLSIPAACPGHAETTAAYRFFDNPKTTPERVLQPHRQATLERVRAEKVVLAAQDTTELDLTRKDEKVGGPLNDPNRWGLYVHPVLVMTPDRVPLGVIEAEMWSRDPEELKKDTKQRRRERRLKPIEDKESYRWLQGYEAACQLAAEAPDTTVVSLSDSEADIYELFLAAAPEESESGVPPKRAEWIVRAGQVDRTLENEGQNLHQLLMCRTPLGTFQVQVSPREASTGDGRKRRQAREGRVATVTVRTTRTLLSPPDRTGRKLEPVYVNVVLIREDHPPEGEEPIEWLLLTSLPIETFAQACRVAEYYGCRWEIEIFFRVLKSGCGVEKLQLEREDRVQVCVAMYLIVAWRVMQLLMLGRECPELSCESVLTESEWKSVWTIAKRKPLPETPPTLGEMVRMIAGLGGYLGRTCDGPPGPKAMWIGLQRTRDYAIAWNLFGPAAEKRCVER